MEQIHLNKKNVELLIIKFLTFKIVFLKVVLGSTTFPEFSFYR